MFTYNPLKFELKVLPLDRNVTQNSFIQLRMFSLCNKHEEGGFNIKSYTFDPNKHFIIADNHNHSTKS